MTLNILKTVPILLFITLFFIPKVSHSEQERSSSVQAIFFTSSTCPFCIRVTDTFIDPFTSEHESILELVRLNTARPEESQILRAFWDEFSIEESRRGVPTVVIGEHVLVGAAEIPSEFPGLVMQYYEQGGVELAYIPGLEEFIDEQARNLKRQETPILERIQSDLPGNYIALFQLAIMLTLLVFLIRKKPWHDKISSIPMTPKLIVAIIGFITALYLTYGESTQQAFFCGPVGQCNLVQQSSFAMLFGVLPLGLLGAFTYALVILLYFFIHQASKAHGRKAKIKKEKSYALLALISGTGFLFSILLTFWQPFIIGATCIWCLIVAITMSLTFVFNRAYLSSSLSVLASK